MAELLLKNADAELKRQVHDAFSAWLEKRVQRGQQPACVTRFVEHGWPLEPGSAKIVTFYRAFCAFFREKIKHEAEVERIFLAETVSTLSRDIAELKGMKAPTMEGFQGWLGDQLGELKGWMAEQFERVHGRFDTVDAALADVRKTLAAQNRSLKDLSQSELATEFASRVANLSSADLLRLIGYSQFNADISRIVKYAPAELIGREAETKLLKEAWEKVVRQDEKQTPEAAKRPHVVTFVALGGEGKPPRR